MRISELSRRADVPVATVKFYLREGLLPPGELTSATQARYADAHLERLRLVRALVTGVGLSIDSTRQVLALIDHPPGEVAEVFGAVQQLLTPTDAVDPARERSTRTLVEQWGWTCEEGYDAPLRRLAGALAAVDAAGFEIPDGVLDRYAAAMHAVAELEIAHVPRTSLSEAVRYMVLGSVLMEPVLLAVRRLAEAQVATASEENFRPG